MATPTTVKLMVDGELEECLVRTFGDETHCKAKSGRVFKFPASANLATEVKKHNQANAEKPVFATEADEEADAEWEAWA